MQSKRPSGTLLVLNPSSVSSTGRVHAVLTATKKSPDLAKNAPAIHDSIMPCESNILFLINPAYSLYARPSDCHAVAPSGEHALRQNPGVLHLAADLDSADFSRCRSCLALFSLPVSVLSSFCRAG